MGIFVDRKGLFLKVVHVLATSVPRDCGASGTLLVGRWRNIWNNAIVDPEVLGFLPAPAKRHLHIEVPLGYLVSELCVCEIAGVVGYGSKGNTQVFHVIRRPFPGNLNVDIRWPFHDSVFCPRSVSVITTTTKANWVGLLSRPSLHNSCPRNCFAKAG